MDFNLAKTFAEERNLKYIETSAKDDTNVTDAFRMLVDIVELERPVGRVHAAAAPLSRQTGMAARSSCCTIL